MPTMCELVVPVTTSAASLEDGSSGYNRFPRQASDLSLNCSQYNPCPATNSVLPSTLPCASVDSGSFRSDSFRTSDSGLCIICFSEPAVAKTNPCGHSVACAACLVRAVMPPYGRRSCPVCRAHVASAVLNTGPMLSLSFASECSIDVNPSLASDTAQVDQAGLRHRTSSRSASAIPQARSDMAEIPSWIRQTNSFPTVVLVAQDRCVMRSFLNRLYVAFPSNGPRHGPDGYAILINGLQYVPLVLSSSTGGHYDSTLDLIGALRPVYLVFLADMQDIGSFSRIVQCDLKFLMDLPNLSRHVFWVLLRPDKKQSFKTHKQPRVEISDISAAKHYVAIPRICFAVSTDTISLADMRNLVSCIRNYARVDHVPAFGLQPPPASSSPSSPIPVLSTSSCFKIGGFCSLRAFTDVAAKRAVDFLTRRRDTWEIIA